MTNLHIVFDRVCAVPVATKTPEGKSYREIEKELLEKLPPEWHDTKEIGYSKDLQCKTYYGFAPWWRLRERLRQIVGSNGFRFEVVATYLTGEGDPVTVGIMNILGVEHQGIGYGRSHGGYKGGKEEIAFADAWKNAAEQHGLGAYLDDQLGLVHYLVKSGSVEAATKGRLLAIQFQKANRITLDEIRAWDRELRELGVDTPAPAATPSKPVETRKTTPAPATSSKVVQHPTAAPKPQQQTPAPAPTTQAQQPQQQQEVFLYPHHNTHIKNLRERLGLSSDYILQKTGGVKPGHLGIEKFEELLQAIAAEWACRQGKFSTVAVARTALDGSIQESKRHSIPLVQAIHIWLDSLTKTPVGV